MHPWFVLFVFVLVAFATYAPSLNGELIWDDPFLVGENPFLRSPVFAVEVFRHHLFSESFSTYYRPVQNLSYMLDYWLWGNLRLGFHCTNVLIHALAAWLLFLLLNRLLPALWKNPARAGIAALLVSLIWLVHPVHNAAVAYISGRADSLAALFALAAWLLWRESRNFSRWWTRTLSGFSAAALALAALCSKEIALVWALLFVLHAIFFERTLRRRDRIPGIVGLAAVVAIYAILHSLPEHRPAAPGAVSEAFGSRAILMLRALGDYCGLMIAPVRLMMERSLGSPGMYASRSAWWRGISFEYLSLLGAAALVAAAWLCMRRGEARTVRRFGALWFFVAFVPISNLIPLNAQVAEHWIYLASIGFFLLLAGTVALLPPRAVRWSVAFTLAAVIALAVRTNFRAADWADGETFARRTIERTIENGDPSPRLLTFYANELGRKGRLAEQEQVYRRMLAVYPDFTMARINLGVCLQKQGRAEEAKALLDIGRASAVVPSVPRNWNAALNAAGQLHKEGRSAEALALVREWIPSNPHTWELVGFEANVLRETQGPHAALAVVEKYAFAHWWHLPSQLGMASLQREAGDYALALKTARNAQRLDIRGATAFDETAKCQASLGRLQEALESEAVAVARARENPAYLEFFAALLHQLGREAEAQAAHRKAETLAAAARQHSL
jgi:tetratricopeptide (TPR) repeat protein